MLREGNFSLRPKSNGCNRKSKIDDLRRNGERLHMGRRCDMWRVDGRASLTLRVSIGGQIRSQSGVHSFA